MDFAKLPLLQFALLVLSIIQPSYQYDDFCEECYRTRVLRAPPCSGIKTYKPWKTANDDATCSKYEVKLFPEGTFEPLALAGPGNSGVHEFAKMIEQSTGIVVGSIRPRVQDSTDYKQIRCGLRAWDGKTILQRTHHNLYNSLPKWYRGAMAYEDEQVSWPVLSQILFKYRGVMVVRNPWHSLVNARVQLQGRFRHLRPSSAEYRVELDFEDKAFAEYLGSRAEDWVDFFRTWIQGSPDGSKMVIVKFEDLVQNPAPELRRVMAYLNVTVDEARLDCLLKNSPPKFEDDLSMKDLTARVAPFFRKQLGLRTQNILEDGIAEINKLMEFKGIEGQLDYAAPTDADFAAKSQTFIIQQRAANIIG